MKNKIFVLLSLILLSCNVNAQLYPQKDFGGILEEELTDVIKTKNGNYFVTGYSSSSNTGNKTDTTRGYTDNWLLMLDSNLNIIWQKTIGGSSGDYIKSTVEVNNSNFLCFGYSSSTISGEKTEDTIGVNDYWLYKLDGQGNILWQKVYGGNDWDEAKQIVKINDNKFILAGTSLSGLSGNKTDTSRGFNDYWIVCIDSIGNILWDKTIGGSDNDNLESISVDKYGNIILSGNSFSPASGEKSEENYGINDVWIVKLDSLGNIIWDKVIGGNSNDAGSTIYCTNNKYYILSTSNSDISGTKTENSIGSSDFWITVMNYNGDILWDKTIGGSSIDISSSILVTNDNKLLLSGTSNSNISGYKSENRRGAYADYWVICIDTLGNYLWDKTIGGDDTDYSIKSIDMNNNNFLLCGTSYSNTSFDKTQDVFGYNDYWLVELDMSTVGNHTSTYKDEIIVYPNPTNNFVWIKSSNNKIINIEVLDIYGRQVLNRINTSKVDMLSLKKGIYIFKIQTENNTIIKKIIYN